MPKRIPCTLCVAPTKHRIAIHFIISIERITTILPTLVRCTSNLDTCTFVYICSLLCLAPHLFIDFFIFHFKRPSHLTKISTEKRTHTKTVLLLFSFYFLYFFCFIPHSNSIYNICECHEWLYSALERLLSIRKSNCVTGFYLIICCSAYRL